MIIITSMSNHKQTKSMNSKIKDKLVSNRKKYQPIVISIILYHILNNLILIIIQGLGLEIKKVLGWGRKCVRFFRKEMRNPVKTNIGIGNNRKIGVLAKSILSKTGSIRIWIAKDKVIMEKIIEEDNMEEILFNRVTKLKNRKLLLRT